MACRNVCASNIISYARASQCVDDFIKFLPVLCYENGVMKQLSASDVLDMAMNNTSATLLARRWESALLVNVDNFTLQRLMNNKEAMAALMKIKGFRSLNQDIETIINKTDAIKKKRKENEDGLSPKEKKQLSDAEKEIKSKRKQIQEKLMKFATRIPIFMYLTGYREYSLKDVILQLEPKLFERPSPRDSLFQSLGGNAFLFLGDRLMPASTRSTSGLSASAHTLTHAGCGGGGAECGATADGACGIDAAPCDAATHAGTAGERVAAAGCHTVGRRIAG